MPALHRHHIGVQHISSRPPVCASVPQTTTHLRSSHARRRTLLFAVYRDVASAAALQDTLSVTAVAEPAQEPAVDSPSLIIPVSSAQSVKCPLFSGQTAATGPQDAQAVKEALRDLPHGPGWAVINPDEVDAEDFSMPLAEGRFCWNPLIGEVRELSDKGMGPFLLERYKEFGPVFTWQMGPSKITSILDYETIKSIMQYDSKVVKSWSSESIYAILGEMVRVQNEDPDKHLVARKLNAPGFTPQALAEYIPKFVSITSAQLSEWASVGSFDLAKDTKDLSFEFSTQLLVNLQVPRERKAALREKFDCMFQAMSALPIKLPGTPYMRGIQARAEVIEEIKGLLADQRQQGRESDGVDDFGLKANVLDTTLGSMKYLMGTDTLTDDDIASSGVALIIAGNDTSGLGIMGMLGLLALQPEVMDKLRKEQQQVIAAQGDVLNKRALEAMPYADAVAREALRITPPAPQLFRRTLVNMQIGGKFIPAGSILSLAFFIAQMLTDPGLHKYSTASTAQSTSGSPSKSYLDNIPEHKFGVLSGAVLKQEFKPERWLSPKASSSSVTSSSHLGKPSGLLTFGSGRHECLGKGLFMNEAKVILALLARHYELALEKPDDFTFRMGFVVEPQEGCIVKLHRRQ